MFGSLVATVCHLSANHKAEWVSVRVPWVHKPMMVKWEPCLSCRERIDLVIFWFPWSPHFVKVPNGSHLRKRTCLKKQEEQTPCWFKWKHFHYWTFCSFLPGSKAMGQASVSFGLWATELCNWPAIELLGNGSLDFC